VSTTALNDKNAVLQLPEFRALLGSRLASSLGRSMLVTVISYQVYLISRDPLALGWLGLAEAVPALGLALFGGHFADRHDRRRIILMTGAASFLCMLLLMLISMDTQGLGLFAILAVVFAAGIASGFSSPAMSAFEMQVIPLEHAAVGASWQSSVSLAGSILGPAVAGFALALIGAASTYLLIAALIAISVVCIALIAPKPLPPYREEESMRESLSSGVRYVFKNQYLVGSMALDLFAVLFGGAMAMLPIFAEEILKVGPVGLGFLRTAPSIGALLVMLWATRRPPTRNAGRNLFVCVAGFGVSMIVFALSQNFWLSMVALFFSGVTDGISMIIRSVIVRVMSPEHMRGRVASVSMVFIGASNEIGALESGIAARLLGVTASVFWGGVVTLLVVGTTAFAVPKLRRLKFDRHQNVIEEEELKTAPAK
jgi:MFS family permease